MSLPRPSFLPLRTVLTALGDLFIPRTCLACGRVLGARERDLCLFCRADLPLVKAMQQAADPEKVAFVSVSFDRTFEALEAFAAENGLSGVQLFEPAGKKDSAIAADYGVKWIPSYYVIDPDGKVVFATVVAKKVATLLQGKNPGKVKARLGNLCSDESCLLDFQ